jgi:ribosome biogenesis GTPase
MHEGLDVGVGDWVGLSDGLIRTVLPRRSAIVRNAASDQHRLTHGQTLAANVDVAFVVSSLGPDLEPRRIERYLVTIWESGATPEIVLTKADRLEDPWPLVAEVEAVAVGAPIHVVSAVTGEGCDELRARIAAGTTAVLLGSSGVGKSTLVNALVPDAQRATGVVNAVTGRGRHTSSSSVALRLHATEEERAAGLPAAGWVIDTPGIRSFGLGHVDPANILRSFAARSRPIADPPDGIPLADAHDWEIVDRVAAGELGDAGRRRLESLQKLLESQGGRVVGADDPADLE